MGYLEDKVSNDIYGVPEYLRNIVPIDKRTTANGYGFMETPWEETYGRENPTPKSWYFTFRESDIDNQGYPVVNDIGYAWWLGKPYKSKWGFGQPSYQNKSYLEDMNEEYKRQLEEEKALREYLNITNWGK